MPELPEVETTRRGISPFLVGQTVQTVTIRQRQLRWPIPAELDNALPGQIITAVNRRAKYVLLQTAAGTALVHLGMSGSLRITDCDTAWKKHDHVSIELNNGRCLRLHDPRRFGALLWTSAPVEQHPLLRKLGPEPLGNNFNGPYLYDLSRQRRTPVKLFIMDGTVVVGAGNIYASEALFMAGIDPRRTAGRISLARYEKLATAIRQVLQEAIAQGGTTLRDFVGGQGEPGYFKQYLRVYDRQGEPCRSCQTPIRQIRLGQRSSYYCPHCQH
ncbi:MAG: bifunctional DNA-formamidopyrimidine glycosylase/DNA-(apurinic or apyrimidinic site) lyase [Candidatus Competibacteraceae bacterium]|nr:bifunctional DNA-formamidopyrimidine glycosylase/DNA-(apurinic or apyrimidinic site) lyase [Candidatus Competibacteraceae bacterium]